MSVRVGPSVHCSSQTGPVRYLKNVQCLSLFFVFVVCVGYIFGLVLLSFSNLLRDARKQKFNKCLC